jgi:hypothetical protein
MAIIIMISDGRRKGVAILNEILVIEITNMDMPLWNYI